MPLISEERTDVWEGDESELASEVADLAGGIARAVVGGSLDKARAWTRRNGFTLERTVPRTTSTARRNAPTSTAHAQLNVMIECRTIYDTSASFPAKAANRSARAAGRIGALERSRPTSVQRDGKLASGIDAMPKKTRMIAVTGSPAGSSRW